MIRISDIDSIDHITEFESAADYTITLRKWQEMNVPISVALPPRSRINEGRSLQAKESVFEAPLDSTEKGNGETDQRRWKFQGPWLARKSEDNFQQYILHVRSRKAQFREFLRGELQPQMVEVRKRAAMALGEDLDQVSEEVSEGDIDAYIRKLRQDRKSLHQLIEKFLDLPNYYDLSGQLPKSTNSSAKTKEHVFMEEGPPQTHPSAGLSYLRTASHIFNHPLLGPRNTEPPVQGRILKPQRSARGKDTHAMAGVAGVVAYDDRSSFHKKTSPPGIREFDPDIPGGTKQWYHPEHASIDSRGRLNLTLKHADGDALAIYEGILPEGEEEKVDQSVLSGGDRQFPSSSSSLSAPFGETSEQGYGLERTDNVSRSGREMSFQDVSEEGIMRVLRAGNAKLRWRE